MSLCISQSHRVLSAENNSTHTHTHSVYTPLCTMGIIPCTAFPPGKPSWDSVTLAAVPDKCPLIGMDGGEGTLL